MEGLRPLSNAMRACGPAVTVRFRPGDNMLVHAAIMVAQPGDVLVISAEGDCRFGLWGQIVSRAAMKKGIAATVIDGAVRDVADIIADGYPVWSRGVSPRGGEKVGPGEINCPLVCGGLDVHPGDVVIADCDGVAVVPADRLEEAIAGAEAKLAAETKRFAAIERGDLLPDWVMPALIENGLWREEQGR
jgi:4-hydroxy-4-methyl-2-oxoglutarate aldolase